MIVVTSIGMNIKLHIFFRNKDLHINNKGLQSGNPTNNGIQLRDLANSKQLENFKIRRR